MINSCDSDDFFLPIDSVNDAVIANPELQQADKLAGQSFSFCFIEVLGQPFQPGQNALLNTPAKPPQ